MEVVPPAPESRDRTTEPQKYAAAGIPNFRRVEPSGSDGRPLIHGYGPDPITRAYVHAGTHRDRVEVDKPYDIAVGPTAVDGLWAQPSSEHRRPRRRA